MQERLLSHGRAKDTMEKEKRFMCYNWPNANPYRTILCCVNLVKYRGRMMVQSLLDNTSWLRRGISTERNAHLHTLS